MNPVFKSRFASTLVYVAAVVIILGFMLPLVWTFMTSLKDNVDSWSLPPQYFFTPKFDNYKAVILEKHFLDYAVNSGIVAICSTIISLILGTLTAYGLDRYAFKGSNLVFFFFFWVYMVPATIIALPLFLVAVELGLVDTHIMLIIAHSTFNTAFATWMMKGFLQEVPREIEESAMIDGTSPLGSLFHITIPVVAPGLAVTSVFCFMYSWNDFPFALVLSQFKTKTLPIAVGTLETPFGTAWGEIAATIFVGVIPIFIFALLVQKWMIRGLSFGAIK